MALPMVHPVHFTILKSTSTLHMTLHLALVPLRNPELQRVYSFSTLILKLKQETKAIKGPFFFFFFFFVALSSAVFPTLLVIFFTVFRGAIWSFSGFSLITSANYLTFSFKTRPLAVLNLSPHLISTLPESYHISPAMTLLRKPAQLLGNGFEDTQYLGDHRLC